MLPKYKHNRLKYGNIKTEYKGTVYASKLEAYYAKQLDAAVKGKAIKSVEAQYRLILRINGADCGSYYADFLVTNNDGTQDIWDVKGVETALFKLKWKIVCALYSDRYIFKIMK